MFSWEFLKLSHAITFRNTFTCVEELNYMKDNMKVKITKIACKFAVKIDKDQKLFLGIIKRKERFQRNLFDRVRINQDLTLYLSCKPKVY